MFVLLGSVCVSASFFPGNIDIVLGKEFSHEKSWEAYGMNFGN